jgi:tetratricopeptide (TPR) repeat protein
LSARVSSAQARIERTPDDAASWCALGDAWRAYADSALLPRPLIRRALEDARSAYTVAVARDTTHAGAKDGLARALLALERHGEAEPLLRERLATAPTAEAEAALATLLFGQRRWAELRDLARAAVAGGRADATLAWWAT